MTCVEFNQHLDAWLGVTLSEADARALERHAAECVTCGTRLDIASHLATPPRDVAPPDSLRATTLNAVAARRTQRRWRRTLAGAAAVAAAAVIVVGTHPAAPPLPLPVGPRPDLLATSRARPELAALDAAEQDVERALRSQPADSELAGELARIRRQRETLEHLLSEVRL